MEKLYIVPEKKDLYQMRSNELLNTDEAAQYLGYKKSYIYNLVHQGKLKARKCGRGLRGGLRFVKSDLDDYLGI